MRTETKLLGGLSFVSRTFEGHFKETPYVLDMDANLYVGPADHLSRDEHSAIEVVFHFLSQTGRIESPWRDLLRNRHLLLSAYAAFDEARLDDGGEEFRIYIFGTYDGETLIAVSDDELPAGPCGRSVNELKRRFYATCKRLDADFLNRGLDSAQQEIEKRFAGAAV
ncbi:MAG: hypothetical protein DRQ37_05305 [Gammaproteobacteria bacterium]|nr:MAG: hypothetical protein DRQ37_05305 [Gammaproteobacteria bacterium]